MRRLPTAPNYRRMLSEASRNPSTRLPTPEPALSQQERRRLWTAVSITALPAHGVRLPALPTRPGNAEVPLGPLPTRPLLLFTIHYFQFPPPLPTRAPQALDCCEHHSSPCARSAPTRPLRTRLPPNKQPKALDCWEYHSSLCARSAPASPLRTSPLRTGAPQALDRREYHSALWPRSAPTSPPPNTHPSEQAAEGSGLLSALHLSLRTECAYPPPSEHAPRALA